MSSESPAAFSEQAAPVAAAPAGRRLRRNGNRLSTSDSVIEWMILSLVGLSPWLGVWLFGGVRLWSVGPLMALVFLATALCALRYFRVPSPLPRRLPPAFLPFAAFVLYGLARIPTAAVPYEAFLEVLKPASALGAYWVWSVLAGRQGRWRWLAAIFLTVVTVMAWYAIIQHAHGSRGVLNLIRPTDYAMRASGAYFCPNHFANLLAMTVPFALAVTFAPAAGLPLRMLSGYSLLVLLPPLFLTQSRSGWIGLLAGLTVTISVLGLRRGFRRFLLLAIVTPLILAALGALVWAASPMVQARVAEALAGNIRLQLWQDTLLMIRERLWLGWGPGSYRWVYPHFWHHMKSYLDPQFAHNDYLHLVAEYGLVGLALVLTTAAVAITRLFSRLRTLSSDRGLCLLAGWAGAFAATAAHAGFDYNFHIYGNVQAFIFLTGLTAGILLAEDTTPSATASRIPSRAVMLAALPALLFLAMTVRAVAAYAFALQGDFAREVFQLDDASTAYERSIRIEPDNGAAWLGLGHVWGGRAFWNRDEDSRATEVEEALAAYRRTRELNPWEMDALFGMSRMYAAQGEPEEALRALEEVVDRVPHHRGYLGQLGLQLRRMGRDKEALEVFRRVRAMGPDEVADLNIQLLTRKKAAAGK